MSYKSEYLVGRHEKPPCWFDFNRQQSAHKILSSPFTYLICFHDFVLLIISNDEVHLQAGHVESGKQLPQYLNMKINNSDHEIESKSLLKSRVFEFREFYANSKKPQVLLDINWSWLSSIKQEFSSDELIVLLVNQFTNIRWELRKNKIWRWIYSEQMSTIVQR